MRTIEKVVKEINDNAQYRNGGPTYLFEGYDVEKALHEILEIHKNERPQGEWIETTWFTEIASFMLQCPICHEKTLSSHKSFCPNCGAKLNLKETESDDDPPMEYFENGGI